MSRSTQFIGLTADAKDYIRDFKPLPSDRNAIGMFGEEIPLGKWEENRIRTRYPHQTNAIIREVVQTSPWSSGPMIFTCLEIFLNDIPDDYHCQCFNWVYNPGLNSEFNYTLGHFNV